MTEKKKRVSEEERIAMRVSKNSIAVNLLLSAGKLTAGLLGHSAAMVSDAVHSASDVLSTFIVMIGVKISGKNPTPITSMDMNGWSAWQQSCWQSSSRVRDLELAIRASS